MKWSKEELEVLDRHQNLNSKDLMAYLPNRTYEAIVQKRNKLGVQWAGQLRWEDWEQEIIESQRFYSSAELASKFLPHRTESAVHDRRNRTGFPQKVHCKDCGTEFVKNSQHNVCSSCAKDHNFHNHSVAGKFRGYKHGAKRRGMTWNLSLQDFSQFWNAKCDYCGEQINGVGIDRVDNSRGYEPDNCVPCCETCNEMKLDHSKEKWLSHIRKILQHAEASNETC